MKKIDSSQLHTSKDVLGVERAAKLNEEKRVAYAQKNREEEEKRNVIKSTAIQKEKR